MSESINTECTVTLVQDAETKRFGVQITLFPIDDADDAGRIAEMLQAKIMMEWMSKDRPQ